MCVLSTFPTRHWPLLVLLICAWSLPDASATAQDRPGPGGADSTSQGAYDVQIAPNPLRVGLNGTQPRLRVDARRTGLTIEHVHIYSMAGDLVRRLDGSELGLPSGTYVPMGTTATADDWWDLRSSNGSAVASGFYWIRLVVTASVADGPSGRATTLIRPFVLIR